MALEISKYIEMKAANKITLLKIGPITAALAIPQYDVDTGEPKEAQINTFNVGTLDADIAKLQAQLDALQALRADVAAVLAKV